MLEATALPTALQPLPYSYSFVVYFVRLIEYERVCGLTLLVLKGFCVKRSHHVPLLFSVTQVFFDYLAYRDNLQTSPNSPFPTLIRIEYFL